MTPKNLIQYFAHGKGPLTNLGGVDGLSFIRTKYANASFDYPDIEIHFVSVSILKVYSLFIKMVVFKFLTLWKYSFLMRKKYRRLF